MIQRLMVRVLAGREATAQRVSADTMLDAMDRKLDGFSALVKPAPQSRPRTPFDGPNGENLSPARSFSPRQMLKMLPQVFPLIFGMWRSSRMYNREFQPTQSEASEGFVEQLRAMALAAGARDIRFIKVPPNAVFRDKGIPCEYAIVFTVEMGKDEMNTAPSFECMHEVARGYKRLAQIGNKLAKHMHAHGFAAYPGTALGGVTDYVHLAEIAGLGAIGYHGLLITPGEGARLRINTIYTNISNLPLANDEPNEHRWVRDFCAMCRKCVRKCPADAIAAEPEPRGDGGMQCIDHDACRDYFANNYGCAVCLSVCPFSRASYDKVKAGFKGNPEAPQFTIAPPLVQLRRREPTASRPSSPPSSPPTAPSRRKHGGRRWAAAGLVGALALATCSLSREGEAHDAEVVPAAIAGGADPAALVGCWDMVVELPFPVGAKKGELCFAAEEGQALSAKMFIKKKWRVAESVAATPGHVTVVVDAPVGRAEITADFDAETMSGHFTAKVGKRPFRAQKKAD